MLLGNLSVAPLVYHACKYGVTVLGRKIGHQRCYEAPFHDGIDRGLCALESLVLELDPTDPKLAPRCNASASVAEASNS